MYQYAAKDLVPELKITLILNMSKFVKQFTELEKSDSENLPN